MRLGVDVPERLHDHGRFTGLLSTAIKNMTGATKAAKIDQLKRLPIEELKAKQTKILAQLGGKKTKMLEDIGSPDPTDQVAFEAKVAHIRAVNKKFAECAPPPPQPLLSSLFHAAI